MLEMLGTIITWCIFGLIVGSLARFLMPGSDPMGCAATIGLGIAGSVIGGFLASLLMGVGRQPFAPAGFIGALVGSLLLLFLLRKLGTRTNR